MGEKIEPAMTPKEWNEPEIDVGCGLVWLGLDASPSRATGDTEAMEMGPPYLVATWNSVNDEQTLTRLPAIIALANAALPDDDPRKVTHETVRALRSAGWALDGAHQTDHGDRVRRVADVLESYLPPV
jgi:hypothetical protein